ncbi:hypothetical protein [Halopelagius fulvigenes]|uniref:Uncharacterized protein n=1 Tax=Halopelagius fulvigenes TaxID=1198324 RepID=A0ABD5TZL2_9EURY
MSDFDMFEYGWFYATTEGRVSMLSSKSNLHDMTVDEAKALRDELEKAIQKAEEFDDD